MSNSGTRQLDLTSSDLACLDVPRRVNVERAAGAWCPLNPVMRSSREFLEVALPSEHVISAVLTQGRYGRGQGVEYTRAFSLEYWRQDVGWRNYSLWSGDTVGDEAL